MLASSAFAPLRLLAAAAIAALGAVALVVAAPADRARAATNPDDTGVYATVDFFVYAEAGEEIRYDIEKVTGPGSATVVLDGPGVSSLCILTLPGESCADQFAVAQSGIWRIRYDTAGGISATTHSMVWDIEVLDPAPVPGRVWTEQYEMTNFELDEYESFDLWYLGEFGDLYAARYTDFNGVNSTFSASAVGLVPLAGGQCTPTYRSSQRDGAQANPLDPTPALRPLTEGECGGRYRIFFENPDASMPPTTTRWDGTTTWLFPPVIDPLVTNLSYAATNPGSLAGVLAFDVTNFLGTLAIEIDANDDGDVTDPVDRVIPYFVSSFDPPTHQFAFDGLDGLGALLPPEVPITMTVSIDRAGELHFVNTDVEVRGGLQIEALRGPAAGDARLYWDDSTFAGAPSVEKCSVTPLLDGSTGVDSSGGPLHGWGACAPGAVDVEPTNFNNGSHGSWGDARHIHDWTYRAVAVSLPIQALGVAALPPTGPEAAPETALSASVLLLAGLGLVVAVRAARRRPATR